MTTATAAPDRDAALMKVYRLFHWYARRWVGRDPARRRFDPEDIAHAAVLYFLRTWHPRHAAHLARFVKLLVLRAGQKALDAARSERVKRRRVAERPPVEADPPPAADEIAALRAAVGRCRPATQHLLAARFGLGGQKPKLLRELAGGLVTKEAARVRVEVCVGEVRSALLGVS